MDRGKHSGRLEHLACFLPGMLALGVSTISPTKFPSYASSEKHLAAAKGLAETCYLLYAESALGLSADEVQLSLPTSKFRKPKSPLRSWSNEYSDWMASGTHSVDSPPGTKPKALPFTSPSREWTALRPGYLLRPEVRSCRHTAYTPKLTLIQAIESMYILWRTTHETKWRDYGWAIFEAIEKHTRVKHGFASVQNAGATSPTHLDDMPSWFLAET
jgi:mannosyl-oligosaccharide alpha-1,2-mannosidase